MKKILTLPLLFAFAAASAQTMTPETLWSLGRVGADGVSGDGTQLVYTVTIPNIANNDFDKQTYVLNLSSGDAKSIEKPEDVLPPSKKSPASDSRLVHKAVKIKKVTGEDYYPNLDKSDAKIYDNLHFRHWDRWEDGKYNHVFIVNAAGDSTDIMAGEPFDTPTVPFGGAEDYIWTPDGKGVIYVCKKLFGTEYVNSTNTDLYRYDLATGKTTNLTTDNPGYDTNPAFSSTGTLAWLSMARDGYESDKNDLKIDLKGQTVNLTGDWDGSVRGFKWSADGGKIYFNAAKTGTVQLFEIEVPKSAAKRNAVKQVTDGTFDVTDIVGQAKNGDLICGRTDMNHAKEYYAVNPKTGEMRQLTRVNDETYAGLKTGKIEKRMVKTTDGKDMVTWVIYPPDFDPAKKYPTLLYTQGGPQSPLSQFYSFRWNFQIMAANGYIIVAPNRRGMPGYGREWNEQISKDYGGQNMQDYLSAIDAVAKEPFVDKDRLGCVGASYGGYSVFYLAGIHEGRFKTFISHDGIFNLRSLYGTTEEQFFVNWDLGGPYWDKGNAAAQKSYSEFNPIDRVGQWDTPILIIQGGKDFRVTDGQAFEAFTAAQQRGIKSRLLYFPEENHWVLSPQNGLVWQKEFFRWLGETL